MSTPIIEAVPKAAYVATLKLAHELALELCGRCADRIHHDQVLEIETALLEAGVTLPDTSPGFREALLSIRRRLEPRLKSVSGSRLVVPRRTYYSQTLEVSQCEFAICTPMMQIVKDHVVAFVVYKERDMRGGYSLKFEFRDRVLA